MSPDIPPSPLDVWQTGGGGGPQLPVGTIQKIFDQADRIAGQAIATIMQWLINQLTQVETQTEPILGAIASPILSQLNDIQGTINTAQQTVQQAVAAGLATTPPLMANGGTVQQGVKWGQFRFNVASYRYGPPPKTWGVAEPYQTSQFPVQPGDTCFLGGWADYIDAVAFSTGISWPYATCPVQGGQANPLPVTQGNGSQPTQGSGDGKVFGSGCDSGLFIFWFFPGDPAENLGRTCIEPQCYYPDDPTANQPPTNDPRWKMYGPYNSIDAANAAIQIVCPSGPTCDSGLYTVWGDTSPPTSCVVLCDGVQPDGAHPIKIQSGMSLDAANTLASQCGTVTGPTQPPPPPPCCPCINFPSCMQIDLCDWKKFEDSIYNALCRWYEKCVCNLTNQTNWLYESCDGGYVQSQQDWLGPEMQSVVTAPSVDDLLNMASVNIGAGGNGGP